MTTTSPKHINSNARFLVLCGALLLWSIPSISDAEPWELRTTRDAVPGTHEIEAGKVDKAINLSNAWLPHVVPQKEVAILTNLCIAYTLKKEFEQAEEFCEQAVGRPNSKSISFNNRGVLRALQGDYDGAAKDFADAATAGCHKDCTKTGPMDSEHPRGVAMRNLERVEYRANAASTDNEDQVASHTD